MIKLKTTSSKDTYMAILDILDIQGISREQNTTLDENSNWLYTVYVNEADLEKAEALLKVELWEEAEEDYGQYGADVLMDELIYHTKDDDEKRETVLNVLKEKGVTAEAIEQKIKEEIEIKREGLDIGSDLMFIGYFGLLLLGLPSFRFAKKIYYSKEKHPITNETIYSYSAKTRRYAANLMTASVIVFVLFVFWALYLNA